jgi:hypothetical protein
MIAARPSRNPRSCGCPLKVVDVLGPRYLPKAS